MQASAHDRDASLLEAGRQTVSQNSPHERVEDDEDHLHDDVDMDLASPHDHDRWSYGEHARFMQALEAYGGDKTGDEWQKIALFVRTRSIDEVRRHGRVYLHHLMHTRRASPLDESAHHSQQHRRLQLSRMTHSLMVHGIDPLQYPLTASRELANNQNDPHATNQTRPPRDSVESDTKLPAKANPLISTAALSAVNTLNAQASATLTNRKPGASSTTKKVKVWTFQEDKVLETALASWQRGKPYSWPKIATTLPGKTAKDVRLRYDQLVEDIASIDSGGGLRHQPSGRPSSSPEPAPASTATKPPKPPTSDAVSNRPKTQSGLSSRIAPPPPIQVPPPKAKSNVASLSPGIFPASARSRHASTPSFLGSNGMLSPTLLDFLANDDKQPLPFASDIDLPSPLLPSPVPGSTHIARQGLQPSPIGLDIPSSTRRRQLITPKGSVTPRIWQELLSDDLKLFDKSQTPSARAPRSSANDPNGQNDGNGQRETADQAKESVGRERA